MRSIERKEAQTGRMETPPEGGSIGARVLAMAHAATREHARIDTTTTSNVLEGLVRSGAPAGRPPGGRVAPPHPQPGSEG